MTSCQNTSWYYFKHFIINILSLKKKNILTQHDVCFCQVASSAFSYRKQTIGWHIFTAHVCMNSWLGELHQFGRRFSYLWHAWLLVLRSPCVKLSLHLQCYAEMNCVEMKTLKLPWHNLEKARKHMESTVIMALQPQERRWMASQMCLTDW